MIDLAAMLDQLPALSWLAFAAIGLAGLAMGVAPSSLPLISVVVGYVAAERGDNSPVHSRWHGLRPSVGFVLGMATVDAAIGAVFGFIGYAVLRILAGQLVLTNLVLAVLLLILGAALLRWIRLPWPTLRPGTQRGDSFAAGYALGLPFGLATCPACTPMVLPILGAAAASGQAWVGAAMLTVFGLTRGVPVLLAGIATGRLKRLPQLGWVVPRMERIGGVLLFVVAAYFLYQSAVYAGIAPALTA